MLHNGTDERFQIEDLWRVFDHLIAGRPVIYYACPISSGTRFIEWWNTEGHELKNKPKVYHDTLNTKVIKPNVAEARKLFLEIATHPDVSHISPAVINFPCWSHAEWMKFWLRFIEQEIISEIVFLPGWYASVGCVMEYRSARSRQMPVREIDRGIELTHVIQQMYEFLQQMRKARLDTTKYETEYQEIRKLLDVTA